MPVCGYCGGTEANSINALCSNCGKDFWVQPQDFKNPELKQYIKLASDNLNMSIEEFRDMVENLSIPSN